MRLRGSGLGLWLLLVLEACTRAGGRADASHEADASVDVDASPRADASASADADADANVPEAATPEDDDAYLLGVPRTARSIGHTSVVLKVELSTGKKAVFKPASRRGPVRYKGEIAARRLALALGLPNVPRVFFRAMDAKALADAVGGATPAGELFTKEAIVTGNVVKGALMPWIDGLAFLPLEREPLASRWKVWLKKGEAIPDDQQLLARQVSILVAFDFVSGNWDRWSGGNVGVDKTTGTLLFIDNDGAFFDVPPSDALQKNKRLLLGIDRYSRSFVLRMRELDDDALAHALGEESPGVPLLSTKALDGVRQRRKQLLQIIDTKRGDGGDDALLYFP